MSLTNVDTSEGEVYVLTGEVAILAEERCKRSSRRLHLP